jgi:membrane-associated protein
MIVTSIINIFVECRIPLLLSFNPEMMIQYGGLLLIMLAVYAQTGLFFCFFLPSGIFLFTGGVLVATGQLQHSLFTVCICTVMAAVAGCLTGYWFGRKTGPLLYKRKDSRLFRQKHLKAAEAFYNKYGQFALTIGLLFPIIRTFAPVVAGMIRMGVSRFVVLVFIGAVLWTPVLVLAGYIVGIIPGFKQYLPYLMPGFILLVTTPIVIRIVREMKKGGKDNSHASGRK